MNILSDAAIGGLAGGATAGPAGAIIGAGGSVLSSLLGGLFGSSAQDTANETNLQIARERNEFQERLFNQQIANDWKMFDATNKWNSAAEQRKRMEAAGFNPNMIFGSGLGSAQNISSPSAPNLSTAQVQPVDAFSRSIGSSIGDAAQVLALLSQSRKTDAEATATVIDNFTRGEKNVNDLVIGGSEAAAKFLDAYIKQQTKDDVIRGVSLDNEVKEATRDKWVADKAVSEAQKALVEANVQLTKSQEQEVLKKVELLVEEAKTEVTKQDLNNALKDLNLSQAQLNRVTAMFYPIIAKATAASNYAQAEYYGEAAKNQTELAGKAHEESLLTQDQRRTFNKFGITEAEFKMLKSMAEKGQVDKATELLIEQARKTNKEANWYDINQLMKVAAVIFGLGTP